MKGVRKISFFIILAFSSLIISNQAVFADQSLTISLTPNPVTIDTLPGNFESASQDLTVSTNNIAGYTVKMATAGSSTSLVHTEDSSKTIPTFTLPSEQSSIPVASLGDGYGYSLDNGASYLPVPDPNGVPDDIFHTSTPGEGSHTLTFGVKAPANAAAGTYTNTFTIYAVVNLEPCAANSICYYGNDDDGTGSMPDQPVESNNAILMASNFSRPGYGFAGWNTEIDGTGTNYGPSQTITTGDLSVEGLQLYARWIPSAGDLQNWNGCEAMNTGDITALTDTRDNNTYAVMKYVDDNCWFMENMRLDLSNQDLTISASNTNNPTPDFITAANAHPASTNNFCTGNTEACINRLLFNSNNTNRDPTLTPAYDTNDASSSWYSYGNYYNWYTATAGNGTFSLATVGATVVGDLCPAGWRLPTAFSDKDDYAKLDKLIGGNGGEQATGSTGIAASERWRAYPFNYIYSGEQNGTTAYNRGKSGSFNTANVKSNLRSVNFWIRAAGVSASANSTGRQRGQTMRCIAVKQYVATGTIHYDSNGGTGTMADATDIDFATATAATNLFTKTNSAFAGWNTKADGSGTMVAEGGLVATAASEMGIEDGGTLTLYATWKPIYSIIYDGNGADAGSMSMANHINVTVSSSVGLVASNYSLPNYGFAGWSTDQDAATKLANGETVTVYGPNESVYISNSFVQNADANNNITLYAVWLPATTNMQNFGTTECSALGTGSIISLTDSRDNNTYAVAKLADGNCWMIENLRLDPSSTSFASSNTNSPTASFITDAPNSASENILCGVNSTNCVNKIAFNANNIDRTLTASYNTNNSSSSWYSYGVLYNWYTVSAGNGTTTTTSGNVAGDICPTGWRLPTGGSANVSEISALNNAVNAGNLKNDSKLRTFPNNFIYSGDYNTASAGGRGSYGRYWTSTASSDYNAYRLGFTGSEVTPVRAWNKWVAFPARCMIKDPTAAQTNSTLAQPEESTTNTSNAAKTSEEINTDKSALSSIEPSISSVIEDDSSNASAIQDVATTDAPADVNNTKSNSTTNASYSDPLGVTEATAGEEAREQSTHDTLTTIATIAGAVGLMAAALVGRTKEDDS